MKRPIYGECDCCQTISILHHCWPSGVEAFACAKCHGYDPTEWQDEMDELIEEVEG